MGYGDAQKAVEGLGRKCRPQGTYKDPRPFTDVLGPSEGSY